MEGQRLDKWLWCARLVKTRSLAAKLVEARKVRINGERALKVCRHVRLGDVVTGTGAAAGHLFVVRVAGVAQRRGPAPTARSLYEDLAARQLPRQWSLRASRFTAGCGPPSATAGGSTRSRLICLRLCKGARPRRQGGSAMATACLVLVARLG
jgi:ribosome-associated heat shock protein Hsp15